MKFFKRTALACLACSALVSTSHAATSIVNGDFESGSLSGWSLFQTSSNGTYGPADVVMFDVDGDGIESRAARFKVGQISAIDLDANQQGGGIRQNFVSLGGQFAISVDIASAYSGSDLNGDGGLFDLILDGSAVASHDFGEIAGNTIQRSSLHYIGSLAAGTHELAIRMQRPFIEGPFQYVDNVVIAAVPEPAAGAMWGFGIALLIGVRRTQANKARA